MSLSRYVLPALLAAGSAVAQCSVSGTTTIQNSGDASALASCSTFTGNIAIATGTTDDIELTGINRIKNGGISINDAPNITTLGGDDLQTIDDDLTLNNVQTLQTLNFAQLSSVGTIAWTGLPNLATLNFQTQISDANMLNIDNTFLSALTGINLTRCNSFSVSNNGMLQDLTINLSNVTGPINIFANGNRLNVDFPNLQSAQNITIRNATTISLPVLQQVNGSVGFLENDNLQTLSCPKLTTLASGGSLSINNNVGLQNFSFPVLKTVGGAVNVENNTALKEVTFPNLTTIMGAFDAFGAFTNVSLPAITDCKGAFNVQSSEDISADCNTFAGEHGTNLALKSGDYMCLSQSSNPNGGSASGSSGSSGSSGKTGAAGQLDMPSVALTGSLCVFLAAVGML